MKFYRWLRFLLAGRTNDENILSPSCFFFLQEIAITGINRYGCELASSWRV